MAIFPSLANGLRVICPARRWFAAVSGFLVFDTFDAGIDGTGRGVEGRREDREPVEPGAADSGQLGRTARKAVSVLRRYHVGIASVSCARR
jgi:hypothetical protein